MLVRTGGDRCARSPRARRTLLEDASDPRARWTSPEGDVSPRARRTSPEGALCRVALVGRGGNHGVVRVVRVC
jgi:hypothetical protein